MNKNASQPGGNVLPPSHTRSSVRLSASANYFCKTLHPFLLGPLDSSAQLLLSPSSLLGPEPVDPSAHSSPRPRRAISSTAIKKKTANTSSPPRPKCNSAQLFLPSFLPSGPTLFLLFPLLFFLHDCSATTTERRPSTLPLLLLGTRLSSSSAKTRIPLSSLLRSEQDSPLLLRSLRLLDAYPPPSSPQYRSSAQERRDAFFTSLLGTNNSQILNQPLLLGSAQQFSLVFPPLSSAERAFNGEEKSPSSLLDPPAASSLSSSIRSHQTPNSPKSNLTSYLPSRI